MRKLQLIGKLTLLVALAFGFALPGYCQSKIDNNQDSAVTARNTIIALEELENDSSNAFVNVSLDRNPPVYEDGERIVISVNSSRSGYLYVFNMNPDSGAYLLYPNVRVRDNFIDANTTLRIPSRDVGGYSIVVGGPNYGEETIKAFVVDSQLSFVEKKLSDDRDGSLTSVDDAQKLLDELEPVVSKCARVELDRSSYQENSATGKASYTSVPKGQKITGLSDDRYAICIVVSKYGKKDRKGKDAFVELPFCKRDGEEFKKVASKNLGVPSNHWYELSDGEATKKEIEKLLKDVAKEARPGSIVFILWTGHGVADSSAAYLIPYDALPNGEANYQESYISSYEFSHWLQDFSNLRVCFFIDACHGGGHLPIPKGVEEPFQFKFGFDNIVAKGANGEHSNIFGMTACLRDQSAYPSYDGSMSFFTKILVDEIKKAPANATHKDLAEAIIAMAKTAKSGRNQTPFYENFIEPAIPLKP